jgi:c-di-GMP-binding flagellar brake protein YcgR
MLSPTVEPRLAEISDGDDRYRVRGTLEIETILRRLIATHATVSVHASGFGSFFVTAVLAFDEDDDTLILDYGVDAAMTERLLQAPRLSFATQLDHVRIQFSAEGAERVLYDGGLAFRIAAPDVLVRLQRREFYRLRIPRGRPLYCAIKLPGVEEGKPSLARASLPVYDISCGGLALSGWPATFRPQPAMALVDTWLELPDLGTIVADLHVVHVQGIVGQGASAGRFGCRFVKTSPGAITLIQRYINRIEREQKALA